VKKEVKRIISDTYDFGVILHNGPMEAGVSVYVRKVHIDILGQELNQFQISSAT
jgi:hypothetical protein